MPYQTEISRKRRADEQESAPKRIKLDGNSPIGIVLTILLTRLVRLSPLSYANPAHDPRFQQPMLAPAAAASIYSHARPMMPQHTAPPVNIRVPGPEAEEEPLGTNWIDDFISKRLAKSPYADYAARSASALYIPPFESEMEAVKLAFPAYYGGELDVEARTDSKQSPDRNTEKNAAAPATVSATVSPSAGAADAPTTENRPPGTGPVKVLTADNGRSDQDYGKMLDSLV